MKTKKSNLISLKNKTLKSSNMKSFSPSINKKLDVKSLKSLKKTKKNTNSINLCNNLLEINIGTTDKPKCIKYNKKKIIDLLLNNLRYSKYLNPSKFIAPKQLYANCWFNTMFVTFFFSHKGRKFFRYFRNLMITGRKYDNSIIEDKELRKLLFIFNLYIEASYNQNSKTSKQENNLYSQIKKLTNNLDTNYLIIEIYNRIKKMNSSYSLPNLNEAGNPLEFYKVIMSYLNYNILKILNINVNENIKKKYNNIEQLLKFSLNKIPDIIIFEDEKSKIKYSENYVVELNNKKYEYVLDSIILTNKEHYKPEANSHFVSLLTINKEGYKFDGSSYSKLSKFNWKKILNKNIDFTFKENPEYIPEKYTLYTGYGYKIYFYYLNKI
tara:strand:- start:573 stop:1718 length:1146 start_codon:yes stop_codon:yes gene_type:complete